MQRILLFIYVVLLIACNNNSKPKQQITIKQSKRDVELASVHTNKQLNANAEISKNLIGIWADGPDQNSVFKIDEKTFYYTDHFNNYPYKVTGDSVKITYEDTEDSYQIRFKGRDTLIMSNNQYGETTFFRMKN